MTNPLRSFRGRLALFSVLATMIAVLGALVAIYHIVRSQTDHQLDNALEKAILRILRDPMNPHIDDFDSRPDPNYFSPWQSHMGLLVLDRTKHEVYFQSKDWPTELHPDDIASERFNKAAARVTLVRNPAFGRPADLPRQRREPEFIEASSLISFPFASDKGSWRVGIIATQEYFLLASFDAAPAAGEMRRLWEALLIAFPLALALCLLGSFFVARQALKPVAALTITVARVREQGLQHRVPLQHETAEFQELITEFNAMMDRLERSFHATRRFTADAAHELRTPLAVLQGRLEQEIQDANISDEQRLLLTDQLEEIAHLKSILEKLLLLSQSDEQSLPLQCEPLDVSALAEEICEDVQLLDAERVITCQTIGKRRTIHGDRVLLAQVFHNLLINAINHGSPRTPVTVRIVRAKGAARSQSSISRQFMGLKDEHVAVSVTNVGQGISPDDRDKIFDRFHRSDKARTRSFGGAGLGLSLVREIVKAHGGDVILADASPEHTTFVVRLPIHGAQSADQPAKK
ncbi:HAMP domain-containing protein [Candidatus Sumerlaeota bacterium]|nr:HAMP domain-containing protein [Candidatus Sumerlaeota bacterium]